MWFVIAAAVTVLLRARCRSPAGYGLYTQKTNARLELGAHFSMLTHWVKRKIW